MGAPPKRRTIVNELRRRCDADPTSEAVSFTADGEHILERLDYGALDRASRSIASQLQGRCLPGDRALLIHPQGMEYIRAFFGCQYAGVIAVPVYPPNPARLARTLPRLRAIVADARPSFVLTTTEIKALAVGLLPMIPELADATWIATDDPTTAGDPATWVDPNLTEDATSFLQYTSGSTGRPKGVIVSFANLFANAEPLYRRFWSWTGARVFTWLPLYHDMGLIGTLIGPLINGVPAIVTHPLLFLQRPHTWMRGMFVHRCSVTGAPNFAFELAVRKVSDEQRAELDLAHVEVVFNGAEPIRSASVAAFLAAYERCGLRRAALLPCYGLAEATLYVSGTRAGSLAREHIVVDDEQLGHGRAVEADGPATRTLMTSGPPAENLSVKIVDQSTLLELPSGHIGEIWVSGPSIAAGYWDNPEGTAATFGATLGGDGTGPKFLRTGDLGFVDAAGQLFVTGRSKDLIILRGRNYYPQDIELVVEQSHPAMRHGCNAAFAVEIGSDSELVVVQEYERRLLKQAGAPDERRRSVPEINAFSPAAPVDAEVLSLSEALSAARAALSSELDLIPHAIALVKAGQVPKTSSGKTMRSECRRMFLANELEVLESWVRKPIASSLPPRAAEHTRSATEIRAFVLDWLANHGGQSTETIDVRGSFVQLGLDSRGAARLAARLTEFVGRAIPASAVFDHPTPDELAAWVANDGRGALPPENSLNRLIAAVKEMSDEEVEAALATRKRGGGHG